MCPDRFGPRQTWQTSAAEFGTSRLHFEFDNTVTHDAGKAIFFLRLSTRFYAGLSAESRLFHDPQLMSVAVNFSASDPDSSSSDFEEVQYPPNNWAQATEQLPLYHMEEKARRRTKGGVPSFEDDGYEAAQKTDYAYNDEGKDVYNKMRSPRSGMGGGRPRMAPPPPPTSIVRISLPSRSQTDPCAARIPATKPRIYPARHLHPSLLLYSFP